MCIRFANCVIGIPFLFFIIYLLQCLQVYNYFFFLSSILNPSLSRLLSMRPEESESSKSLIESADFNQLEAYINDNFDYKEVSTKLAFSFFGRKFEIFALLFAFLQGSSLIVHDTKINKVIICPISPQERLQKEVKLMCCFLQIFRSSILQLPLLRTTLMENMQYRYPILKLLFYYPLACNSKIYQVLRFLFAALISIINLVCEVSI